MGWPMLSRVERQVHRLHKMMERLGVLSGTLVRLHDGQGYTEARTLCLSCDACEACNRWLADPAAAEGRPTFCPNLPLLEACMRPEQEVSQRERTTSKPISS